MTCMILLTVETDGAAQHEMQEPWSLESSARMCF